MIRIALVGDHNPEVTAHRAIPLALALAAKEAGVEIAWDWVPTDSIGAEAEELLQPYSAIWCVPASPYASTAGALAAIRFARESGRAFLGTCGGFQHALLEYAASVWRIHNPAHAEMQPEASDPVITPLECSLVEAEGVLHFIPGTRLARIYDVDTATEEYHCRYGLNPNYAVRLESGPLHVAARDDHGEIRAVELDGHPFYIGTLFQPERAALQGRTPPLVRALVAAAATIQHEATERA